MIWSVVTSGKDAKVPEIRTPWQVDVRDVARTHIAALEQMTDTNERYLIAAETWSHQRAIDIIHESTTIPTSIKDTTPIGTKGQRLSDHFDIDSSKAQKRIG
ncbi:unnamed protein product, partial [Adineta steineri]